MNEPEQPRGFHRYTSFCLEKMFAELGFWSSTCITSAT